MTEINDKFIFLSKKVIFVSFFLVSCNSSSNYSIGTIKDYTNTHEKAILKSLLIDGRKVENINNLILPKAEKKYQEVGVLYNFDKIGNFQISTNIFYKDNFINAKCEIIQSQPYCLIKISFDGSNVLRCVCDF